MLSLLLHISAIGLFGLVAWQDYKFRGVSWFLFPVLMFLACTELFVTNRMEFFLFILGINLSFLLILLLTVSLYFSTKNKKLVNIADTYLGWGDILFFVVLAFLFSPLNFMLFLVASFIVVIGLVLIRRNLANNIPLAGIQACLLIILFVSRELGLPIEPLNDYWAINLLNTWS